MLKPKKLRGDFMGIVGFLVVFGMVFGGYVLHGGHLRIMWQPTEYMVIFGGALGAIIVSSPISNIKAMVGMMIKALIGGGIKKADYLELLQMMYRIFQVFRKDGPQAVEKHIEDPMNSEIFKAYPSFIKNHHAVDFFCDTMKITLSADLSQYDVDDLLDQDIKVIHEEEHAAQSIMTNTADAMPGLGIVAAVQGVILTMGKLTEGTEAIGQSVAAALVGTFFGVMAGYCIFGPIATKMQKNMDAEGRYLKVIKAALVALQKGAPPLVCVEYARRSIYQVDRPSFEEMDSSTRDMKKAA
jgi:chemotaxis protein MotA